MKALILPSLVALALTGCTSSDQAAIGATAPVSEFSAPSSAPESKVTPVPALAGAPTIAPGANRVASGVPTVTTGTTGVAGFPLPPACGDGSGQPECARTARVEKCRTVGAVTTCDVPADPLADNTHYTN